MDKFIRWFDGISMDDVSTVGGKNASLGEMYRELVPRGIKVPNGFAVTADAYHRFIESNQLREAIGSIMHGLDTSDVTELQHTGRRVRQVIGAAHIPEDLAREIVAAYEKLSGQGNDPADVAVRSSATAEDLPDASFAGQQDTYLNIEGSSALLESCKRCFASLFTDRAISYRVDRGFEHLEVALSIGVQEMVRADLASSGVMFSIDTESGFPGAVLINAAYGLGENVVQGAVNPDEYYVFKPTLMQGFRPILQKVKGSKELRMVYDIGGGKGVKNLSVPIEDRTRFALDDEDILTLARWACLIEEHYSEKYGRFSPMDMEWAKDGRTGELFIVQARPETVQSHRSETFVETFRLERTGRVLTTGRSVGERVASGRVRIIQGPHELRSFVDGEILVSDKTAPDWEPIMKRAAAIVTNRGGRTCHAAIVSRELGVPAIVGCEDASEELHAGQEVTVSCCEGDTGSVYEGVIPYTVDRIELEGLERPRTQIMMNVANPQEAMSLSFIPNDGVGLAREEFIINNSVKIHPLALIEYDRIEDQSLRAAIDDLTIGYRDKAEYFVDTLAHGIAMIAAAFYPKDVIVRLSDFKSNEYANLIGGSRYEPEEENPMIGFRGASRYYDPRYADAFALECRALAKVRDDMGLVNVKVMIPFCRTVEEARRVQQQMKKQGLERGQNGLELYLMCELPSNVILADEFSDVVDGFSIGSNDLTQLILGVDRDSQVIARLFDERDPAVMAMIARVIRTAKRCGKKIGLCGQAPSDYPDFARFLVDCGIDSISLNPDAVMKTTLQILDAESSPPSSKGC